MIGVALSAGHYGMCGMTGLVEMERKWMWLTVRSKNYVDYVEEVVSGKEKES